MKEIKTLGLVGRDGYIDFLRGCGLLLLIVAHTHAPEWLNSVRTFDVPLMVFLSSICYKPMKNGYLDYVIKRVKRIYIPVVVFLSIFFLLQYLSYLIVGKPHIDEIKVIGSYLMLNDYSIGYVWIMRVFLMMALIIPLVDICIKKLSFWLICVTVILLILIQFYLVEVISCLSNRILRIFLDQTLLYVIGYLPIAIVGLKAKELRISQNIAIIVISAVLFGISFYINGSFDPQTTKYPPQGQYILYGLMCSSILWSLKNSISHFVENVRAFKYLSEHSMWLYLWHIIPIYLIYPISQIQNMWFGRFCIVLVVTLILNYIYSNLIKHLPDRVYRLIK